MVAPKLPPSDRGRSELLGIAARDFVATAIALVIQEGRDIAGDFDRVAGLLVVFRVLLADLLAADGPLARGDLVVEQLLHRALLVVEPDPGFPVGSLARDGVADHGVQRRHALELARIA